MKKQTTKNGRASDNLNSLVRLIPTEGGYQKTKEAFLTRETKTLWIVEVSGEYAERRFRKSDCLEVKRDFPRYKIELPNVNGDSCGK